MTIDYQLSDVDARGVMMRAQDASLEAEHQAIALDVLAVADFSGGAGTDAVITQLGRDSQVIYGHGNTHALRSQTAGSNRAGTNSGAGPSGVLSR
jgi:hypothetical protein